MITGSEDPEAGIRIFHDMRQPLNIIRLATDNLRTRILPALGHEDAVYLASKLERIERQIERSSGLIDSATETFRRT